MPQLSATIGGEPYTFVYNNIDQTLTMTTPNGEVKTLSEIPLRNWLVTKAIRTAGSGPDWQEILLDVSRDTLKTK